MSGSARPVWTLNHVLAYGQSYGSGWDGFPPLSTTPRPGLLMLGESVRPLHEAGPVWAPCGPPALRPLLATVQRPGSSQPIAPAEWGGLDTGQALLGETILEGALASWQARRLTEQRTPPDAGGALLASTCAVGGRTIEQLSRGAHPPLLNRLSDCVRLARGIAGPLSYGVVALLVLQGESNIVGEGTRDRAAYKTLLWRLLDDIAADLPALTAQAAPPLAVLYQSGGAYAEDGMGVPQAQLEVALERPGTVLAGPAYPYPDARGHLDANGYRWLGAQFGKVLHLVLTRGERWLPLHPLRAELVEPTVLSVRFAVPHPPLRWGRPFVGQRRRDIPDGGFTVLDADGTVPLARLTIAAPDRLRIDLARPAGPDRLRLRYADKTAHFGCGALLDSDPAISPDPFVPLPGAGYAAEDLAELAGHHYKLPNWCVGFAIDVARP